MHLYSKYVCMRPNEIWGFIWERDLGQGVALFFPEEPILCRCLAFSLTYCGYRIRERPHFIMIDKVKLCSRPRDVSVWYFKPACVYVRRSRLMFTCQQNASERCLLWVSDFFSLFPGDETSWFSASVGCVGRRVVSLSLPTEFLDLAPVYFVGHVVSRLVVLGLQARISALERWYRSQLCVTRSGRPFWTWPFLGSFCISG